jgi:hypothetical protein
LIYRRSGFGIAVSLCILAFSACEYENPITSSPTRKVQEQALGNWISQDNAKNPDLFGEEIEFNKET